MLANLFINIWENEKVTSGTGINSAAHAKMRVLTKRQHQTLSHKVSSRDRFANEWVSSALRLLLFKILWVWEAKEKVVIGKFPWFFSAYHKPLYIDCIISAFWNQAYSVCKWLRLPNRSGGRKVSSFELISLLCMCCITKNCQWTWACDMRKGKDIT